MTTDEIKACTNIAQLNEQKEFLEGDLDYQAEDEREGSLVEIDQIANRLEELEDTAEM